MTTNTQRAQQAPEAIESILTASSEDPYHRSLEDQIGDLIADLLHLSESHGLPYVVPLRRALKHFAAETHPNNPEGEQVLGELTKSERFNEVLVEVVNYCSETDTTTQSVVDESVPALPGFPANTNIPFTLVDGLWLDRTPTISGYIRNCGGTNLEIHFEGYGTYSQDDQSGTPVFIEMYNGDLQVIIWSDINSEDYTDIAWLDEARLSNRKTD